MRSIFCACALALASLAVAAPAAASPKFPGHIVEKLGLGNDKYPDCIICHANESGGLGTVVTPFGKYALASGVQAEDNDSLDAFLERLQLEPPPHDTDGDGVSDIDELKAGTNPNIALSADGKEITPLIPQYGCAASTTPASGAGGLAGLLAAVGLVASRRRQPERRASTRA